VLLLLCTEVFRRPSLPLTSSVSILHVCLRLIVLDLRQTLNPLVSILLHPQRLIVTFLHVFSCDNFLTGVDDSTFVHSIKLVFSFEFVYEVFYSHSSSVWIEDANAFIVSFGARVESVHKVVRSLHDIRHVSAAATLELESHRLIVSFVL
jgi:hypothetical protein